MKGAIAAVILTAFLLVFVLTLGWVNVKPSEVAVEINKVAGKVMESPKGVGYHFFNRWVTDMVVYKVAARAFPSDTAGNEESRKYNLELKTNDGQNISVDLTIIYSLVANEVANLHQQIGPNYEDQILLPQVRSEARIVIGGYNAEQIYQGNVRSEIQKGILDRLKATLKDYPAIRVHDALIRHFAFSPDFERAIEQKKLASQQVEINRNQALAQEEMAKKQEAEARGLKFQAVQRAQGEAEAVKINADAKRYSLEQEAAGDLARYKAEAEGKRLAAEALGGGQNVVALEFASKIAPTLQVWGIPVGENNTSLLDVSGVFGKMMESKKTQQ